MKIKVHNKIYEVIRKTYDTYYECYFYYVGERDEPFCDLSDDIEVVEL